MESSADLVQLIAKSSYLGPHRDLAVNADKKPIMTSVGDGKQR